MPVSGVSSAHSELADVSFFAAQKKPQVYACGFCRFAPGLGFCAYALRLSHGRKDDGRCIRREEDGALNSIDTAPRDAEDIRQNADGRGRYSFEFRISSAFFAFSLP